MTKVIIVKAGHTEWQSKGRLVGDTDLRLNETGHRQATASADIVRRLNPSIIHCGKDEPSCETADIIANELDLKVKSSDALREMDLGHWEGLTVEQFRDRFAKVYKRWREEPLSVTPPEGESIPSVVEWMTAAISKILKKNSEKSVAIVVGGLAYGALRCRFGEDGWDRFWDYVETEDAPAEFEIDAVAERIKNGDSET